MKAINYIEVNLIDKSYRMGRMSVIESQSMKENNGLMRIRKLGRLDMIQSYIDDRIELINLGPIFSFYFDLLI